MEQERRDLHNDIVDMKGSVRVMCRLRPELDVEVSEGWQRATHCDEDTSTVDISKRAGAHCNACSVLGGQNVKQQGECSASYARRQLTLAPQGRIDPQMLCAGREAT